MTDNFAQTVNLREKMKKERATASARAAGTKRAAAAPAPALGAKPARKPERALSRPPEKKKHYAPNREKANPAPEKQISRRKEAVRDRTEGIDEIYKESGRGHGEDDLQKISRPVARRAHEHLYRRLAIALAVVIAASAVYGLVFRHASSDASLPATGPGPGWYMVELTGGETYYGKISDIKANPVELTTVYYNYDQLNPGETQPSDGGNLKLVKRGKETAGPSGTMYIYQTQIKTIDELSPDSKVLKAILDNENK